MGRAIHRGTMAGLDSHAYSAQFLVDLLDSFEIGLKLRRSGMRSKVLHKAVAPRRLRSTLENFRRFKQSRRTSAASVSESSAPASQQAAKLCDVFLRNAQLNCNNHPSI